MDINENMFEKLYRYYSDFLGLIIQNVIGISLIIKFYSKESTTVYTNGEFIVKDCIVLLFYAAVLILSNLFWCSWNYKFPKAKKNTHAIAVCLEAENFADYIYIRKVFIRRFKKIVESNDELNIKVVFFQYLLSKKLMNKSIDRRRKIFAKSKYNLIISGTVDQGNLSTGPAVKIQASLGVLTSNLNQRVQAGLADELARVLDDYVINESDDLNDRFEVGKELSIVVEYICGIASVLSGEFDYGLKAFHFVQESLLDYKLNRKAINYIKSRIEYVSNQSYLASINKAYMKYLKTMENEDEIVIREALEIMQGMKHVEYDYHLGMASIEFLSARSIDKCRYHIDKCKEYKPRDVAWKYSKAFIDCYDDKLMTSYRMYKKILKKYYSDILGIESYITKVLSFEPDKIQFNFVLGMINEISKEDYKSAKEYYKEFLSTAKDEKFTEVVGEIVERVSRL
ncbi:hypothetical protein [Fusibacter sp. JL216-2]|uniref:hypothetical protein n=1 Tax=Fusibacter sp. JL216-2 TaxID=3071453 RepID=UPI003D32C8E4